MEPVQVVPTPLFIQQSSQLLALAQSVRVLFELSGLKSQAVDVREIEAEVASTRAEAAESSFSLTSAVAFDAPKVGQDQEAHRATSCSRSRSPQPRDGQISLTVLAEDVQKIQSEISHLRVNTVLTEDVRNLQNELSTLRIRSAERNGDVVGLPQLLDDVRHLQNEARDLRATSGIHESWMQSLSTNVAQARELVSEVTRRNTDCAESSRNRTSGEIADLREKMTALGVEAREQSKQLRELVAACERDVAEHRVTSKREAHDAAAAIEKRNLQMTTELRDQMYTKLDQSTERIEDMGQRLIEARAASQRDFQEYQQRLSESTKAWQQKGEDIFNDMLARFSAVDCREQASAQKWTSDITDLQRSCSVLQTGLKEVRQDQERSRADMTKQLDQMFFTFESRLETVNEAQVRNIDNGIQTAKDETHRCVEEVRTLAQAAAEAAGAAAAQRAERLAAEIRMEVKSCALNHAQELDELRKSQDVQNKSVQEELCQIHADVESNHFRENCLADELISKKCEKMESHVRELWQGVNEVTSQLDDHKAYFSEKLQRMSDRNTKSVTELHALIQQRREDAAAEASRSEQRRDVLRKDLEISHQHLQAELSRLQAAFASEALSTSERLVAQKESVEDMHTSMKQELQMDLKDRSQGLSKDIDHLRTFIEKEIHSLDQKVQHNHDAANTKADENHAALKQARESLEAKAEQTQAALRAIDRMASTAKEEAARAKERSSAADSAVQAAITDWKDKDLRSQQMRVDQAYRALSSLATGVLRIAQACGLLPTAAGTTVQEDLDPRGAVTVMLNGPMLSEVVRLEDLLTWEKDGDSLARRIERGWAAWTVRDGKVEGHRAPISMLAVMENKAGHDLLRQLQLTVRDLDGRVGQSSHISPIDPHSALVAPPMPAIDIDLGATKLTGGAVAPQQEARELHEAPGGSGIDAVRSLKAHVVSWGCDGPPMAQLLRDPVQPEKPSPMTPKMHQSRAAVMAARRHWLDVVET